MGGGNAEGVFALIPWSWNDEPPYPTPVRWHTGDPETDPWEWRMRVLDERGDIAYAKLFFHKSGYIARAWYPLFLAARRGGRSFQMLAADGEVSAPAQRIYRAVAEREALPLEQIKAAAGFAKGDKAKFDRALTELQGKMLLTMCGRHHKLSQRGGEYGWASTVFCTAEAFFGPEVFAEAARIDPAEAEAKITAQILALNPAADRKKIAKFIRGA